MKNLYLGVMIFFFFPIIAFSQDDSDEQAKDMFESGKQLFTAGNYSEAAKQFRGAFEIKPSYKILYNLGQSEAAAKRYGVALETFEKYLAEGGDEIEIERQNEVSTEITRLRRITGIVEVTGPDEMVIYIDGIKRGTYPTTRRIPVAATVIHTISATLGEQKMETEIRVSGGDTVTVDLTPNDTVTPTETLDEPETKTEETAETAPTDGATKKKRLMVAGLALTSVGVGALVAGSICGGLVLNKENSLERECNGLACSASQSDLLRSRDRLAVASAVLWATGGAVAAGGIALIVVSKLKKETETVAVVVPMPGGLAIAGSF